MESFSSEKVASTGWVVCLHRPSVYPQLPRFPVVLALQLVWGWGWGEKSIFSQQSTWLMLHWFLWSPFFFQVCYIMLDRLLCFSIKPIPYSSLVVSRCRSAVLTFPIKYSRWLPGVGCYSICYLDKHKSVWLCFNFCLLDLALLTFTTHYNFIITHDFFSFLSRFLPVPSIPLPISSERSIP